MTQTPPGMEAYEAEVRRRLDAANAPNSGYAPPTGPTSPVRPVSEYASQSTGPMPQRRRMPMPAIIAFVVGSLVSLGAAGYFIVSAAQEGGRLSPRDVEAAISNGPPFAAELSTAQMSDAYLAMWRDGSIYTIIPDTDEGRAYFKAFMYSVADHKAAASISGRENAKPNTELAEREAHFLALEDLDLNVDITFQDGTNFTHDGLPPARE